MVSRGIGVSGAIKISITRPGNVLKTGGWLEVRGHVMTGLKDCFTDSDFIARLYTLREIQAPDPKDYINFEFGLRSDKEIVSRVNKRLSIILTDDEVRFMKDYVLPLIESKFGTQLIIRPEDLPAALFTSTAKNKRQSPFNAWQKKHSGTKTEYVAAIYNKPDSLIFASQEDKLDWSQGLKDREVRDYIEFLAEEKQQLAILEANKDRIFSAEMYMRINRFFAKYILG